MAVGATLLGLGSGIGEGGGGIKSSNLAHMVLLATHNQ